MAEHINQRVNMKVSPYKVIGKPIFRRIAIDGQTYAIEMNYRRTGNDGNTTHITVYLLQNDDEMVEMVVAYREQNSEQCTKNG